VTFQRPATAGDQAATATAPPPARPAPPPEAARISRLEIVPAAEVWPAGAAPLVRWIRANPDVLSDLLGTRLTATDDEVPGLAAAVFAEPDGPRLLAVLELGVSTETTLGSLVARLSAARAAAALWICGDPRDEHVAALSWLNRSVDGRFFMARVRAARIGVSDAAPVLDLVLRPPRASDGGVSGEPRSVEDAERQRRAADSPDVRLGPPTG
jgi:hypothetical protein